MLLIVGIILLTGVFIETASALIILTPVLLPLVLQLGIDPIHFGLIIVVGAFHRHDYPPVAINLYVASSITQLPLERITRAIIPYMLGLIGCCYWWSTYRSCSAGRVINEVYLKWR